MAPRFCQQIDEGSKEKGFTLIEVLLAIAIFAIIIVSLFSSYTGSLRLMKAAEPQADLYRKARVAMGRIADDLESAYFKPGQKDTEGSGVLGQFSGTNGMVDIMDADSLHFLSRAHITFGDAREQVGVALISYYVEESDDGLVLFRSDTPVHEEPPEENTGGLVLCDGLAGINFTYFDASGEAFDEWSLADELRGGKLPERVAVQILMHGESEEASLLVFSTSVALPINGH